MKRLSVLATIAVIVLIAATAWAAVTVRYYNKDSKDYTFPVKCSGSKYEVSFKKSTTSSTTIQGSAPCIVTTPAGDVTLKGGEKIEIKDGEITIQ